MTKDNIVIVVDLGNYKSKYAEKVPFKATIVQKYDNEVIVRSLETSKQYEIYYEQVLEFLSVKEIAEMIDLSKYGSDNS